MEIKINPEIVKRAQNGDIEAIEYIIEKLTPLTHYITLRLIGKRDDIEDCIQIALERVISNISIYDQKQTKFCTWASAVIRNVVLNYKKNYIKDIEYNDAEVYTYVVDERESRHIGRKLSEIEEAIGYDLYEILLLKVGYDMSLYEISEALGIPYHKIRRKYHIAYRKAKEYVEKTK